MTQSVRANPLRAAALCLALLLIAWADPVAAQRAATPVDAIDAFHAALREGNDAGAITLLDRGLIVFESGNTNPDLDDYVNQHMAGDKNYAAKYQWTVEDRTVGGEGDHFWVFSTYRLTRRFSQDEVLLETALLQRTGDSFRIVHIHWSSR